MADFIANAGIPVLIDAKHAIAHNKVMVIDDETIVTGSFNFTNQAEHSNAENLLVIRSRSLAEAYTANWKAARPAFRRNSNRGWGAGDGRWEEG